MVRTQIQLTEEQARALRELAARERVSVAELVRQSVERLLKERERQEDEKWRRALWMVGSFRGGPPDVSTRHDEFLAEDYL